MSEVRYVPNCRIARRYVTIYSKQKSLLDTSAESTVHPNNVHRLVQVCWQRFVRVHVRIVVASEHARSKHVIR